MDIVYAPSETRLLREAQQAGCKTVKGAYMLLYQGVAQFELWTGRKAPVDVMKEILFSRLQAK
jgi:shikimate dehydrogenase